MSPGFVTRAEVVAVARAWIGTPYLHQASQPGAGADCLGLIRGVWRQIRGDEPEAVPAYSPDWSEASGQERLLAAALRHLRPVTQAGEGSVLLFRMRRGAVAKHLGLVSCCAEGQPVAFLHAYSGQGVTEAALSQPWRRQIAAIFDFPWISG